MDFSDPLQIELLEQYQKNLLSEYKEKNSEKSEKSEKRKDNTQRSHSSSSPGSKEMGLRQQTPSKEDCAKSDSKSAPGEVVVFTRNLRDNEATGPSCSPPKQKRAREKISVDAEHKNTGDVFCEKRRREPPQIEVSTGEMERLNGELKALRKEVLLLRSEIKQEKNHKKADTEKIRETPEKEKIGKKAETEKIGKKTETEKIRKKAENSVVVVRRLFRRFGGVEVVLDNSVKDVGRIVEKAKKHFGRAGVGFAEVLRRPATGAKVVFDSVRDGDELALLTKEEEDASNTK